MSIMTRPPVTRRFVASCPASHYSSKQMSSIEVMRWHACRVEYFGVKLEGFAFTEAGWVQSYGSRYVRPPIIYGDVSRTGAITVKEFKYAQSLTQKPVKGMLTGAISFPLLHKT